MNKIEVNAQHAVTATARPYLQHTITVIGDATGRRCSGMISLSA
jgi:hypothetical protein